MSSMLEQLWPVFLAEVSEKLDVVESLIDSANHNDADVDALFREFHTLKSSFSMVDFRVLMELAHACEDVLHGVRKMFHVLDEEILKCLLESVDWMKQQLANASPGHYPQHPNDTLLSRLAPFSPPEEDNDKKEEVVFTSSNEAATDNEPAVDLLAEEKEALAMDTLRISSANLDNLVTNVSQLALRERSLSHSIQDEKIKQALSLARLSLQNIQPGNAIPPSLENLLNLFTHYRSLLVQTDTSMQNAIASIQQDVLDLRIVPLSTIFNRLPRIVRKKANIAGKQVQLVIDGGDVSIDKGMIEIISEPLIHLLHNAVLHGIETADERHASKKADTALIHISASEQGSLLCIEVSDDGRGIDYRDIREKAIRKGFAKQEDGEDNAAYWLNFLFFPGLSAENNLRTTGLDTVKTNLSSIGGAIEIHSTPGNGTRFVMRLPVTVAIQSVILARTQNQTFAIPARHVAEIIETPQQSLQIVNNQLAVLLRDNMLPVYRLDHLLQIEPPIKPEQPIPAEETNSQKQANIMLLILQHDTHCIALAIDDMLGRQELFLRDIHQDLRSIPGIGGVSLLGNGDVVIILDCENLFALAQKKPERTGLAS